jgi:hypothetical protein
LGEFGRNVVAPYAAVPTYPGRVIPNSIGHGYASGSAGCLISKVAVGLMLDAANKFPIDCAKDDSSEDYEIGRYDLSDLC